jgi:hypothetical protein
MSKDADAAILNAQRLLRTHGAETAQAQATIAVAVALSDLVDEVRAVRDALLDASARAYPSE